MGDAVGLEDRWENVSEYRAKGSFETGPDAPSAMDPVQSYIVALDPRADPRS